MSYTRSISQKPGAAAVAGAWTPHVRGGKAWDREQADPSLHKAKLAFFFLLVYTALLLGRPSDMIWSLQGLPLAQIAALTACAAYALAMLQGRTQFIWTVEVKIVFLLTVLYWLGLPFAYWKAMTFDVLTDTWLKTLIIFFLITQTVFTTDRVRKLLWVIILCELIVSTYSLISPRTAGIDYLGGRIRGATVGFLSGNYLGIAAAVTLPYMAIFALRTRSKLQMLLLLSTFITVMLMVVKTASRSGMICVVMALALVWWKILGQSAKGRMMGVAFALVIAVAVAGAPDVFWQRVSTLWTSENVGTIDVATSATESEVQRGALARRAVNYTLQNPLFGLGLGNFAIRSGGQYGAQSWKGAHNTYLQVVAEAGIPALCLFLALLYVAIRNMREINRLKSHEPADEELRGLARATSVSIYAFMLASFFAHLAYDVYLYYLIGMSVALQSVYVRRMKALSPPADGADAGEGSGVTNGSKLKNGRPALAR